MKALSRLTCIKFALTAKPLIWLGLSFVLAGCFPELPPETDTTDMVDTIGPGDIATDSQVGPDAPDDLVEADTTADTSGADVATDTSEPGEVVVDGCAELRCAEQQRACISEGGAARCGDCVAGFREREGTCYRMAPKPTGLEATGLPDGNGIALRWDAVDGMNEWVIDACATSPCETNWVMVATVPGDESSYVDTTAPVAGAPGVPSLSLVAEPGHVKLDWGAVAPGVAAQRYYRVTAVGVLGKGEQSEAVAGENASVPASRFEVQVDGGEWFDVGPVNAWIDADGGPPTLFAGDATASEGTNETHVALALSGTNAWDGAARTYAVRAVNTAGPGAASDSVVGARLAPATWSVTWERSTGSTADGFSAIPGASSNVYSDTGAPADGSVRWYRAVVSAPEVEPATTAAVAGSRRPPPGVPANVRATTDLADVVEVRWNAVSGATGYNIYRNGSLLFQISGGTTTLYSDESPELAITGGWAAPSSVAATTELAMRVDLSWVAPTRPVGPDAVYTVQSLSASGPGGISAEVVGRRAAPDVGKYEIEIASVGVQTTTFNTGTPDTKWAHMDAPPAVLVRPVASASQGAWLTRVAVGTGTVMATTKNVTYRVRAVTGDNTVTPWSAQATGRRATGPISVQWLRTATDNESGTYSEIAGATTTTFDDVTAPANGLKRWYRMVANAPGVSMVISDPVRGWRLAFSAVSGGAKHTCARSVDGEVWCWGANNEAQLGRGMVSETEAEPALVRELDGVAEVVAGESFTCARLDNGDVKCWGQNTYGQLGDGSTDTQKSPVLVRDLAGATVLRAGSSHACALVADGAVKCWGRNTWSQLGDNSTTQRTAPVSVVMAIGRGGGPLTEMTGLALFSGHSCAFTTRGLGCWGYNRFGRLGDGTETTRAVATEINGMENISRFARGPGASHTCANLSTTGLHCWGANNRGQLGVTAATAFVPTAVPGVTGVTDIVVGSGHTCVRVSTGGVKCWGHNNLGQLGNANGGAQSTDPLDVADLGGLATVLGVGFDHTCAIVGSAVKCWGANDRAQLGDGGSTSGVRPRDVQFPQ